MKSGLVESVNFDHFLHAFKTYFDGQYKNNFKDDELEALYNYLWEFADDIGECVELDVIALCQDFYVWNPDDGDKPDESCVLHNFDDGRILARY